MNRYGLYGYLKLQKQPGFSQAANILYSLCQKATVASMMSPLKLPSWLMLLGAKSR
jgi:hypothetical protein